MAARSTVRSLVTSLRLFKPFCWSNTNSMILLELFRERNDCCYCVAFAPPGLLLTACWCSSIADVSGEHRQRKRGTITLQPRSPKRQSMLWCQPAIHTYTYEWTRLLIDDGCCGLHGDRMSTATTASRYYLIVLLPSCRNRYNGTSMLDLSLAVVGWLELVKGNKLRKFMCRSD